MFSLFIYFMNFLFVKTSNHSTDIMSLILIFELVPDWSANPYTTRDNEVYSTETYLYLYSGN